MSGRKIGEKTVSIPEVKKIMENILKDIPIKLKVDIWGGNSWKEAK